MSTQFERDQLARERETRRLHALVKAAVGILPAVDLAVAVDETLRPRGEALARALESFSLPDLSRSVAYYDGEKARRDEESARLERAARMLEELPDAPPRTRCQVQVARAMGRWTDFGRCDNVARRVALVTPRWEQRERRVEALVCQVHARKALVEALSLSDEPAMETSPHFWRSKGLCMSRCPIGGEYCDVRADLAYGLHDGDHRTKSKPRKRWPNAAQLKDRVQR